MNPNPNPDLTRTLTLANKIMAQLDDGDAAGARQALERWSDELGSVFAYSRALIEFIAWRGQEEPEDGATEERANAELKTALDQNP